MNDTAPDSKAVRDDLFGHTLLFMVIASIFLSLGGYHIFKLVQLHQYGVVIEGYIDPQHPIDRQNTQVLYKVDNKQYQIQLLRDGRKRRGNKTARKEAICLADHTHGYKCHVIYSSKNPKIAKVLERSGKMHGKDAIPPVITLIIGLSSAAFAIFGRNRAREAYLKRVKESRQSQN